MTPHATQDQTKGDMMTRIPAFLLCIALLAPGSIAADSEYFGRFLSKLEITTVDTGNPDRQNFSLLKEFKFEDPNENVWTVPEGYSKLDGASIPRPLWSIVGGPMEGNYLHAAVVHDYYCDVKTRTQHDTHRAFYYGMRTNGVPESKAKAMYLAVAAFGPKWKLTKQTVLCAKGLADCNSIDPPYDIVEPYAFGSDLAADVERFNVAVENVKDQAESLDLDDIDDIAASLKR